MCMGQKAPAPAPIQQIPQRVASQAVEAVDKPIELVTADKDVKKKKKLAGKSGTAQLNTALNYTTAGSSSGVTT